MKVINIKSFQDCLESAQIGVAMDDKMNGEIDHIQCAVLDL